MNPVGMFCFSTRNDSVLQRTLGNVWRHFGVYQLGGATGILWIEARDAIEHTAIHRAAAKTKTYPAKASTGPWLQNL